jgi:sialic acid synthase SpsE
MLPSRPSCDALRRRSGPGPFVIAEIGVNHGGDLPTAFRLIEEAARGGADCVKFQTYKAGSLASRHSPAYWDTSEEPTPSQFELFQKHDRLQAPDYIALARHAAACDVSFASTPFDVAAVEMLAPLVPFFKIASADITNEPLLTACARHGKPVLLSTGASYLSEIEEAVRLIREFLPAHQIGIMHCVLSYPTPHADANLAMIEHLAACFPGHPIGYSDHTRPDPSMLVLLRSYLLGATILEKHFTHDKSLPGNDHYHAMDMTDIGCLRRGLDLLQTVEGRPTKTVLPSEEPARQHARRSLVAERNLPVGHVLQADDVAVKRPAGGLPPSALTWIVGKRLTRAVDADEFITVDHVTNR